MVLDLDEREIVARAIPTRIARADASDLVATVGRIDEGALFYLRSRGIPFEAARRMLVAAFCGEALADIADADLRGRIEARAASRLPTPEGTP